MATQTLRLNPNQDPNTPKYNTTTGLLTDYGKNLGLSEVNPASNANLSSTIPVGSIAGTQAMQFPTTTADTTGVGSNAYYTSLVEGIDKQQKESADALKAGENDITKLITDIGGASSTINHKDELKSKEQVNYYTNKIRSEQLATREKIKKLNDTNPTGMLSNGLAYETNRIQNESSYRQANDALSLAVHLQNYELAKEISDRQLEDKLSGLRAELDAKKFLFDNNKDIFTAAETKLFNTKLLADERAYNEKVKTEAGISEIKLEAAKNGATPSQLNDISKATTLDEAIQNAGDALATSQNDIIKLDNGTTLLIDKKSGKTIKNFGGSSATPTIVQRTVNGKPVDGYTLIAGDDPYFIAQKYGTDMAGLKALNPKIADWNNLPIGAVINVPSKNAGQTQALQTILGSSKFTKDQKADLTNAIANGQDPLTVVKNQAKNVMGQTLATQLDKYETIKQQITDLDSLLSEYYANGGKTNIFRGTFEKTLNNLGTVNDPKLVQLATQIAGSLQAYRNSISGTAYSEQEGKDIASIFPGINKTEGLNKAILAGRMDFIDKTIDAGYKNTLGSAYDDLKANSTPPVDPLQNVTSYGDAHPEARSIIVQMQKDGLPIEAISNWVNQFK